MLLRARAPCKEPFIPFPQPPCSHRFPCTMIPLPACIYPLRTNSLGSPFSSGMPCSSTSLCNLCDLVHSLAPTGIPFFSWISCPTFNNYFHSLNRRVLSPARCWALMWLALSTPEELHSCTPHGLQTLRQTCASRCPPLSVPLLTPNNGGPIPAPAVPSLLQLLLKPPLPAAVPPKAVLWPVPGSPGGGGAAKAHRVGEGGARGKLGVGEGVWGAGRGAPSARKREVEQGGAGSCSPPQPTVTAVSSWVRLRRRRRDSVRQ